MNVSVIAVCINDLQCFVGLHDVEEFIQKRRLKLVERLISSWYFCRFVLIANDLQTMAVCVSCFICVSLFMVALCNWADHYILPCSFYLLLSFFSLLISAAADWMSTILLHMAWP